MHLSVLITYRRHKATVVRYNLCWSSIQWLTAQITGHHRYQEDAFNFQIREQNHVVGDEGTPATGTRITNTNDHGVDTFYSQ
ncbi:unnamed protein product [Aphanomyces euteiches]